jgi:uncharacterized protein with PQ loop repeat
VLVIATVMALVASAIFLVRLVPQPARVARTGVAAGVSPLAAFNAVVITGAWLAYGLSTHLVVVWAVSVVALVPGVWMVALILRRADWSDVLLCAGLIAVLVGAAAAGLFAAALATGVLVSSGPQVWRAVRERDLRGISPATWWVAVADALAWGAYGLVIDDVALKGYCVVLLACAVTVLVRLRWVGDPLSAV